MATPLKGFPDSPIASKSDLREELNTKILPVLRGMFKKLAGVFSQPDEFAQPVWDGSTWHSVRLGDAVLELPNFDASYSANNEEVMVARAGALTAPRTYTLVAPAVNANAKVFWNLGTVQYTVSTGSGDMTVPPGYYALAAFIGATWAPGFKFKIVANPEF